MMLICKILSVLLIDALVYYHGFDAPSLSRSTTAFVVAESTKNLSEEAVLIFKMDALQCRTTPGRTAADNIDQSK